MCEGKIAYYDRQEAEKEVAFMRKRKVLSNVYKCLECGLYHKTGNKKRRIKHVRRNGKTRWRVY